MRPTPQGWFIMILFVLLSFVGEAQTKIMCGTMTTKNVPCKSIVKSQGQKCHWHADNKILCGANTVNNIPCKVAVKQQGMLCWRHKKQ